MSEVSYEELKSSMACFLSFGKSLIWSAHHIHMYIFTDTEKSKIMTDNEHFLFDQQKQT